MAGSLAAGRRGALGRSLSKRGFAEPRLVGRRDQTALGWRQSWKRRRQPAPAFNEGHAAASTPEVKLTRVEAILFLAREPLGSRKLAQFASLADGTEARTMIRRLNRKYDEEGTAFRVEEVAGGFQLLTRPKFGSWLRRIHRNSVESRFSAPALETLAVVAYRQPVLRADIEAIRGVDCGEILRQLMDRDLVRIVGRSRELGRPYLYGVTKYFLQLFGLRGLEDLPRAAELRSAGGAAQTKNSSGEFRPASGVKTSVAELDAPSEDFRTLAEP